VFELKYKNNNNILHNIEHFKIRSELSLTSNPTIDPDKHVYSTRTTSSNYYLPDEFPRQDASRESFSILLITARSHSKNLKHVTTLISNLN